MNTKIVILLAVVAAAVLALALYFFVQRDTVESTDSENQEQMATSTDEQNEDDDEREPEEVIGQSVEGRDIVAYHYGDGETELLFVGGIHGGYSWNTVLVAYELMDYLEENEDTVPSNVTVTVIPVMNPDGLEATVGTSGRFTETDVPASDALRSAGRFNTNEVDLNRNFACDWAPESTWQSQTVSGGTAAFSEPESAAIRDYVAGNTPDAVVVWYSAAGGVFASSCHDGVLPETAALTNLYADAAGYQAYESFDFYEITGDMVNWLAREEIPAISVLLSTHEDVEWDKNRDGVTAMFEFYGRTTDDAASSDTESE